MSDGELNETKKQLLFLFREFGKHCKALTLIDDGGQLNQ